MEWILLIALVAVVVVLVFFRKKIKKNLGASYTGGNYDYAPKNTRPDDQKQT